MKIKDLITQLQSFENPELNINFNISIEGQNGSVSVSDNPNLKMKQKGDELVVSLDGDETDWN